MRLEALVFDLDGTLVDTAPDLMAATNHVLKTLKRRPITMDG
jgi:phosphoglycolate phosphatase